MNTNFSNSTFARASFALTLALAAAGCGSSGSSSSAPTASWKVDKTAISMIYTAEWHCPTPIDSVTITNTGSAGLTWALSSASAPWLDYNQLSGILAGGASTKITFQFNCQFYVHGPQTTTVDLTVKNQETGSVEGSKKIDVEVVVQKWKW